MSPLRRAPLLLALCLAACDGDPPGAAGTDAPLAPPDTSGDAAGSPDTAAPGPPDVAVAEGALPDAGTIADVSAGETGGGTTGGGDVSSPEAGPTADADPNQDASSVAADTADAAPADTAAADAAPDTSPPPEPAYHAISPDDLAALLAAEDVLLIDVHIPFAGTIPGTDAHIAYLDTAALVDAIGAKGTKGVLYCLTGPMSKKAVNDLVLLGYWNLYDLTGGMNAWKAAGYELSPDP